MGVSIRTQTIARCVAILCLWAPIAMGSDAAEKRVRADLDRFLRAGAPGSNVEIEMPPLSLFRVDGSRFPGEFRTELSTRASEPYQGRIPITVALYAGDHLVHRGIVSPYLQVSEEVVVASRNLARGETLTHEHLTTVSKDRSKLPRDVMLDPDLVVGRRTRRSLREGEPVRSGQIELVPLVERGDRVMLILEAGALRLQATGRAQEKGALGDTIRVRNLDSKREILGRIDAQGRVRVAN